MPLIRLTKGKVAQVDDVDADLSQFTWHAAGKTRRDGTTKFYAVRRAARCPEYPRGKVIYLHLMIAARAGLKGERIDHRNCDTLDDRRENLRGLTHALNLLHRESAVAGASLIKTTGRWRAYAGTVHLGVFPTQAEALAARRRYEAQVGL